jgi:integrase
MRVLEGVRLRVKDVEFARREIIVREGKGNKDRVTVLPENLMLPLKEQLVRAKQLHDQDLKAGFGDVYLPDALARKYPSAGKAWGWAAPAHPCARGIRTSLYSTICIPIDTAIDRSALGCGTPASLVRTDDTKSSVARRETRAPREAGVAARAAPFVRDPYAAGGLRHSHRPRAARPQGFEHDHDLHARAESRWRL